MILDIDPRDIKLVEPNRATSYGTDPMAHAWGMEGSESGTENIVGVPKHITVLCCGVFDVLHAGHLQLLEQARSLGSTLVVGINSDESVRKGPGRPVNTAEDRAAMLRALRVVDRVVVFEEPTPEALIRMLRPDVYVKGGDYTPEALPEAQAVIDIGGTIALLPLLGGYSTTSTLLRLEKQGAPEVTEVMASDVYLNWSWPGIGFGQLSVSTRGDGRIDCGNECMSREGVRLILRAYADHVASSCELDDC